MSQPYEKEANWTGNSNGVRWNLTEAEIEAARQNMHNGSQEEKANDKHNEQEHSQRSAPFFDSLTDDCFLAYAPHNPEYIIEN
ncbi:hypothetical protein WR25_17946 [Diploscapter pachys]|uniref:Uncharacterized protein n=1 Tax=Diploscapter pachys TaxID=2018661 RepID=A0A2A2LCY6_9BILA|nr:hypothetical protein WR25_17946 [Diploscapter pachys]